MAMKIMYLRSIEEYTSQIHDLEETFFYRGISNVEDFKLIPSAGRFGIESKKNK